MTEDMPSPAKNI